MLNPRDWHAFGPEWRKHPVRGTIALVVAGVCFYLVLAAAAALPPFSTATATPTPEPLCERLSPSDGQTVGGSFTIRDRCSLLAGETVFVVLHDQFPYPGAGEAKPRFWVQCEVKVKNTGDLLCEAKACFDGAKYEILLIRPRAEEALNEYEDWLSDRSDEGREELPKANQVDSFGETRVVSVNHRVAPAPDKCIEP